MGGAGRRNLESVTTLLELVETLARDPEAKAAYEAAPDAYLARNGFGDLTPAEVNEAVRHSADTLPPLVAAQFTPETGLASVAGADPATFDQTFTSDYEDDLFGLDEDSPIFADGELNDAPDNAPFIAPQDAQPDGQTDLGDDLDFQDVIPNQPPPGAAPATPDGDGNGDQEPLRQLFGASDPHDLDAHPEPLAPTPTVAGPAPSDPPPAQGPPRADLDDLPDTSPPDTSPPDTELTGTGLFNREAFDNVDALATAEDQQSGDHDREPFERGAEEPAEDLLDDVGDFDLD